MRCAMNCPKVMWVHERFTALVIVLQLMMQMVEQLINSPGLPVLYLMRSPPIKEIMENSPNTLATISTFIVQTCNLNKKVNPTTNTRHNWLNSTDSPRKLSPYHSSQKRTVHTVDPGRNYMYDHFSARRWQSTTKIFVADS